MPKKLQNKITTKLEKLHELLDKFDEVRNVEPDEPETWDPDTLYNLVENLKETLELLEDKKIQGKYDEFGQPLYETGLCSLVEEYYSEEEDE
jgi:hypothetical protein